MKLTVVSWFFNALEDDGGGVGVRVFVLYLYVFFFTFIGLVSATNAIA